MSLFRFNYWWIVIAMLGFSLPFVFSSLPVTHHDITKAIPEKTLLVINVVTTIAAPFLAYATTSLLLPLLESSFFVRVLHQLFLANIVASAGGFSALLLVNNSIMFFTILSSFLASLGGLYAIKSASRKKSPTAPSCQKAPTTHRDGDS